jgi:hypothetical protein
MRFLTRILVSSLLCASFAVTAATIAPAPASAHSWKEIRPVGTLPTVREIASAIHDPSSNRLILFGGMGPYCCSKLSDLWILTNADGSEATPPQWIAVNSTTKPTPRGSQTALYAPASNRMIVYGGEANATGYDEVWILTDANGITGSPQWQKLTVAAGAHPVPRAGQVAVYDAQNNRMTIFGGYYNPGTPWAVRNDTWVLTNADGTEAAPSQWIQLSPGGALPAARGWAFGAYDPDSNQLVVFGGSNFRGLSFNDVWVLTNANGLDATPSEWVKVMPAGAPPTPRFGVAGGYDPVTGRMVIFGGTNEATAYNDTWLLKDAFGPNPRWVWRAPRGTIPPGLSQMAFAYSPANDKLLMTSGDLAPSCCNYTNRTFVFRWATK